jgi:predicted nuclease with RNAse H fold
VNLSARQSSRPTFAGVDVGGSRKGFHLAVVDGRRVVDVAHVRDVSAAVAWLYEHAPELTAVDAPIEPGPRVCERELARSVCHLYFTPMLAEGPFYDWMRRGAELYAALLTAGLTAIECFPTATWTVLGAPRGGQSRASWSTAALGRTRLTGIPVRLGQDARDAIGAAYTAWLHARGRTDPRFTPIAVPLPAS